MIVRVLPLRSKFGRISIHVYPGPWQLNSNPICIRLRIFIHHSMFCYLFLQNHDKDLFHFIYEYDLEMPRSSNSIGWIHFESNSYFIQYNMLTRKTVHLMSIIQVLRITSPKKFGSLQHMDNIGGLTT